MKTKGVFLLVLESKNGMYQVIMNNDIYTFLKHCFPLMNLSKADTNKVSCAFQINNFIHKLHCNQTLWYAHDEKYARH